uniref:Uncharacterized protein n=1 Tax=Glossina austeni TaxID=7395 RepID=A0A1A9VMR7_GLOAU
MSSLNAFIKIEHDTICVFLMSTNAEIQWQMHRLNQKQVYGDDRHSPVVATFKPQQERQSAELVFAAVDVELPPPPPLTDDEPLDILDRDDDMWLTGKTPRHRDMQVGVTPRRTQQGRISEPDF